MTRGGRVARAAAVAAGVLALAGPAAAVDVAAVRECIRANAPKLSAVLALSLSVREANGELAESRAKLTWRRLANGSQRLLLRYLAPDDLAGSALLTELGGGQPVVHLYLPDLGDPQRVYSEEQVALFLGQGQLDLSELGWLVQEAGRAAVRALDAPSEHAGRPVWALEARSAEGNETRFARVEALVDREWCVPLEVTFFGADGEPRKRLRVPPSHVQREGRVFVPRRVELEDLEAAARGTLRADAVEVDVPIAPGLLTVKALRAPSASAAGDAGDDAAPR